jgi:sugar phosphate isomerase/epimerase
MNLSRRQFFGFLGTGAAAAALPGSLVAADCRCRSAAKIALQLCSLDGYVGKVGFDRALEVVAAIGYKGIELESCWQYGENPKGLRKAADAAGLKVCGRHLGSAAFGFDVKKWTYDPEEMKKTCEFDMTFGNNLLICPSNSPGPGQDLDEFLKRLVDLYNKGAADAAKFGSHIGLHNHMAEFNLRMKDGTTFWDYFFSNTDPNVCMEQDVGWTTCAGVDPCEQYKKYPHRSQTLHAKENGMGAGVKKFDSILGQPGQPNAKPVNWDGVIAAAEKDGIEWLIVECSRHSGDLSAVLPSYDFLRRKVLN